MQDSLKIVQSSYLFDHLDSTDLMSFREVSFTDDITTIFGSDARVVGSTTARTSTLGDINNTKDVVSEAFGFTFITIMLALYMIMWLLCDKVIAVLFKSFTYEDIIDRLNGMFDVNMEHLLRISGILIYLTVAYAAMILLKPYIEISIFAIYTYIAVLVVGIAYGGYKFLLIKTLRYISENDDFFSNLTLFNRSYAALSVIIFLPVIMLVSFANLESVNLLTICLMIVVAISVIHYLITLFYFFKQENVSFLEYILYLCGAEMIPISFVIIFALRNYAS